jgi:hypothetical protein
VLVYRPEPNTPLSHVCEPRLTRLSSGSLLLSHRLGSGRVSTDGIIHLLRSDDGSTWQSLGYPFPSTVDGRSGDLQSAPLAATFAGTVVAVLGWVERCDGTWPLINPVSEGRLPLQALWAISDTDGTAWNPPRSIDLAPYEQASPQALLRLQSGALLATFETFKHYDDPAPWDYRAGLIRSDDHGHTWHGARTAARVDAQGVMWWDPRIEELSDGRLVQFYHAFHHPSATDRTVHVGWSEDGGITWTLPTSTGIEGQMSWPVALTDGRVLLCVQQRHDPKGLVLFLSEDGGRSFDPTSETTLYTHEGFSGGPADGHSTVSDYFADMDIYTFGHPAGIALDDSRVLFCYYAGMRGRSCLYSVTVSVQ